MVLTTREFLKFLHPRRVVDGICYIMLGIEQDQYIQAVLNLNITLEVTGYKVSLVKQKQT